MKKFYSYFSVAFLVATQLYGGTITKTVTFNQQNLIFSKSDGYDIVDLKGYPSLIKPGAPRIPRVIQTLIIPADARPTSIEIINENTIDIPGTYNIYPAQPNIPLPMPGKTFKPKEIPANTTIYSSNNIYPNVGIRINGMGNKNGYKLVQIEIYPLRYIPLKGFLQFTTSITYKLEYAEDEIPSTIPTIRQKEIFGKEVRSIVANPDDVVPFAPEVFHSRTPSFLPSGYYEYVIISEPPMDTVFQRLADWKTKKGVPATVVTVSWINSSYSGYDIQEKIKNFITDAHTNWGTIYVLLAGAADQKTSGQNIVPARRAFYTISGVGYYNDEDTIPSDLYYSDLDNNWDTNGNHVWGELSDNIDMYADVYVGRAAVYNISQAQNFVYKVLTYEKNPPFDYIKKMMLPTGVLWSSYEERPMQDSIARMTPAGWFDAKMYERTGNISEQGMIDSINTGYNMGHWEGHGNEVGIYYNGGWTTMLDSTDADNLTNGDKDGIAISIGCFTGAWDETPGGDCFAEHLMNRVGGGFIGIMMNSRYGWGAYVGGQYVPGPSERIDTTFFANIFESNIYHLGNAIALAKDTWVPYADSGNEYDMTRWCIYELNLLGDPEMPLWTDTPESLNISYNMSAVPIPGGNLEVTVTSGGLPVNNALVCAMKDGEVYKTGHTGTDGKVVLQVHPTTLGWMDITASGENKIPLEDSILVISGVQVSIIPDTINVNTPTDIAVTVMDSTGTNPEDSIEVHIYRYGVSEYDTTNSAGVCTLNVNSPYGQMLWVDGRKLNETWNSFSDTIWVINASNLSQADISAYSDTIGVIGGLMQGIPGTVWGYSNPSGSSMYLEGCGIDTSATTANESLFVDVTPLTPGNLLGTIAQSGYNIYQEYIPVRIYKGWLSGYVINSSTSDSISGARIKGYPAGTDTSSNTPVFDLLSDGNGFYELSDSLPCGDYDIYTTAFGFLPTNETKTIKFGDNTHNILMSPAPSGNVYGTVTEMGTGSPLSSTIKIYRTDNGSLYMSTTTDSTTGGNYSVNLPQFTYRFVVTSYRHIPADTTINLNTSTLEMNFVLDTTSGMILIIDDSGSKGENKSAEKDALKRGRKEGLPSTSKVGASASKFYRWLTDLGYYVDTTTTASIDTSQWVLYNFLIVTSGANLSPLSANNITDKLINWTNKGGKLLVEGGEVGFDWKGTSFGNQVLHVINWEGDNAGSLTKQDSLHPLSTIPNVLPNSIGISYSGYGDEDAMTLSPDAHLIFGTSNHTGDAGILVYDNTPPIESGQVVYYAFNLDALSDTNNAKELVENTVNYLTALEPAPVDTLYGQVTLFGASNYEGCIVTAKMGGFVTIDTTDSSGNYTITGLYDGTYNVTASRDGYGDSSLTAVNISGNLELNFQLYPKIYIYQEDFEDSNGTYTGTGDWEWGIPSSGPGNAHSGVKLWATNLSGNYSSYSNSMLTTPEINLTGVSEAKLDFYQWYIIEQGSSNWDGGNVKISVDGGSFNVLNNVEPAYTGTISSWNSGIPGELGYTGDSGGWQKVSADLTSYVGHTIKLRWHFGSDTSVEYAGWYVDDVSVYYVNRSGVRTNKPAEFSIKIGAISRKNVVINLALPRAGRVSMKVLDITGRVIKSKDMVRQAGYYTDRINLKRSGIYFIRTRALNKTYINKVVVF